MDSLVISEVVDPVARLTGIKEIGRRENLTKCLKVAILKTAGLCKWTHFWHNIFNKNTHKICILLKSSHY